MSEDGSGELDQDATGSTGSGPNVEERVEHTKKLLEVRRAQKLQEDLEVCLLQSHINHYCALHMLSFHEIFLPYFEPFMEIRSFQCYLSVL